MRRMRRGIGGGHEFGGSGEDSFVAVVVTKLTGALLFILLLAMVIMVLIPKGSDLPATRPDEGLAAEGEAQELAIATPGVLPEAIAGRPYAVALAATGGRGDRRWAVDGPLPEGLAFDPEDAQIRGTPKSGTPEPAELTLRVADDSGRAGRATRLVVFEADRPLGLPSKFVPALPAVAWRSWLEQGFGFLLLLLVHLVAMNAVNGLEGRIAPPEVDEIERDAPSRRWRRFAAYRAILRLGTLSAAASLALWLGWPRG